jgi:hypothetical protein
MTDEERFFSKVDKRGFDECWIWKAASSPNGYGKFYLNRIWSTAHRASYEMFVGSVPKDMLGLAQRRIKCF